MSPVVRYLSVPLVLAVIAATYIVLQRPPERPAPRLPAWTAPAVRPAPVPPAPPTAREILAQQVALDLWSDQVVRLRALDRLWTREARDLEAAVEEAQGELSTFVQDAQRARGASIQDIQRRSEEFSSRSAALREGRERHARAALGILAEWQRQRLSRMRSPATSGGFDEAPKN